MWGSTQEFLDHLKSEIEWLKLELRHERQRAEVAIDQLLRVRVGVGSVTPRDESPDALTKEVEALLSNPEFSHAGEEVP